MATLTINDIQQDDLAMSVARALSLANDTAQAHGTAPASALITITEESSPTGRLWRIHYGPRDYINCRGGDLIVVVDDAAQAVQRIIRGQ